jgi:hypothetical protein
MSNTKLSDWIKVYDDMDLGEYSDQCVELFDDSIDTVDNHTADWRRCKIYTKLDSNSKMFNQLKSIIKKALDRYKRELQNGILNFLTAIEAPNIIRYEPNDPNGQNHFHAHSDNWNMPTAFRQLSIILYQMM